MFERLLQNILSRLQQARSNGETEIEQVLCELLNQQGRVVWDGRKYIFAMAMEMHFDSNGGSKAILRLKESEILDRYALGEGK